MKRKLYRFIVLVVLVGFLGYLGFQFAVAYLKSPVDPNGKTKAFVVQKGENISEVAQRLEKEGFIRSAVVFKWEVKNSENPKIEAGDFKISAAMSVSEIVKNLEQGSVDKWVRLVEGWRVEEMARELEKVLGIKQAEFLALSKEGYMFPDTYLFNPEATAQTIAQTLRANFDRKYDDELKQKIRAKGLSEQQGVILASLVEREARSDKVRTEVAGIILKRLKMGMKLDLDATVRYAKDTQALKNGKLEKFWQAIDQEDYSKVISPYNTYLNAGLPPGPICNPSLSSLKAVANADSSTPYLFYYHDSKGNSYYAKMLDEHNANVANHP